MKSYSFRTIIEKDGKQYHGFVPVLSGCGNKKFGDRFLYVIGQASTQSFDEITVSPYPENKIWFDTIEFINKE